MKSNGGEECALVKSNEVRGHKKDSAYFERMHGDTHLYIFLALRASVFHHHERFSGALRMKNMPAGKLFHRLIWDKLIPRGRFRILPRALPPPAVAAYSLPLAAQQTQLRRSVELAHRSFASRTTGGKRCRLKCRGSQ